MGLIEIRMVNYSVSTCNGSTLSQIGGLASGDLFPIGANLVTYEAGDGLGLQRPHHRGHRGSRTSAKPDRHEDRSCKTLQESHPRSRIRSESTNGATVSG